MVFAGALVTGVAASVMACESCWEDYTPTTPPVVLDATAKIELVPITVRGGSPASFFVPMQRRAKADVANMFSRVTEGDDGEADYVIRLGFRWDGDSEPSATVIDARDGTVLATLSEPSPRKLQHASLNLKEAMAKLKADIAGVIGQRATAPSVAPPRHHDPL